jgi:hypothetical protein
VTPELKQARASIRAKIRENPSSIIILRTPMVDNGFGGEIPDPFGDPIEYVYKVRLSHERKTVAEAETTPAGFSTNLSRFILADYKAVLIDGDIFDAIGKSWQIGKVDPLYAFGGIIGYQAPLREAAAVDQSETS